MIGLRTYLEKKITDHEANVQAYASAAVAGLSIEQLRQLQLAVAQHQGAAMALKELLKLVEKHEP